MEKEYELYCLGGNVTAIITNTLDDHACLKVAEKIMKIHPKVEQVAMILKVEKDTCIFRMAGGEFCGNACRAIAEFMRLNYGFEKCNVIINGIEIKAKSDGKKSESSGFVESLGWWDFREVLITGRSM